MAQGQIFYGSLTFHNFERSYHELLESNGFGNAPVDAINAAGTLAGLDVRKIGAQIAKYSGKE